MSLKNLMEDKPLNFNQPILSVRRFSSTSIPTSKKEEDEKRKTRDSFPSVPPLPKYKSELKSGPVRTPGTVPFVWEQTPGMPKAQKKSLAGAIERPPIAPKLPPGRILKVNQQTPDKIPEDPSSVQSNSSSNENITKFESPETAVEEEESSDSRDCDEEYTDAPESFYGNCSVSGLSGFEGPERKQSGTFSTDPQTRDFMMGRFLPAAKAMASEAPPYSSRKQHVQREKSEGVDKQPPVPHHRPVIQTNYAKADIEEESDDDFDESRYLAPKACGLLPRFCLKSSLCLLNPVPGLSVRTRVPTSRVSKTPARSSSSGSWNGSENEICVTPTTEVCEDTLKNELKHGFQQRNSKELDGSSLYRRLQGNVASPQRNDLHQPTFFAEKENLGIPEEANNTNSCKKGPCSFRELLASENTEEQTELSSSSMVEKTLYIDSVVNESSNSNSNSNSLSALEDTKNSVPSFDKSDQEVKIGSLNSEEPKTQKEDNSHGSYCELPIPPPLPTSPSESWLWRTLPSVSSRAFSKMYQGPGVNNLKTQAPKMEAANPKWETIVRTSKDQRHHTRFSEELLPPIPET